VSETEFALLAQAQKGDPQAFSYLVESYQGPVYNLCYRMLGDSNDAEDAAQETFLRAYKGIRRYDGQRPFSTWLLSIAAHYCIDQIRKRRYQIISFEEDPRLDPPDLNPGPEGETLIRENQRKVQGLLGRLQPPDRAAVVMRYWYDFSYEEIAESMGVSVSSVKSRLHRARRDLADLLMQGGALQPAPLERKPHESPAL
jgi:RNA polymerase sigma-70 factor (ECF subfamily)